MLTVPEEKLPKVTVTYSLDPSANTNVFHSSTEDAAVRNIDFQIERDKFLDRLIRGVNRLTKMEREIVKSGTWKRSLIMKSITIWHERKKGITG